MIKIAIGLSSQCSQWLAKLELQFIIIIIMISRWFSFLNEVSIEE